MGTDHCLGYPERLLLLGRLLLPSRLPVKLRVPVDVAIHIAVRVFGRVTVRVALAAISVNSPFAELSKIINRILVGMALNLEIKLMFFSFQKSLQIWNQNKIFCNIERY